MEDEGRGRVKEKWQAKLYGGKEKRQPQATRTGATRTGATRAHAHTHAHTLASTAASAPAHPLCLRLRQCLSCAWVLHRGRVGRDGRARASHTRVPFSFRRRIALIACVCKCARARVCVHVAWREAPTSVGKGG